MDGCSSAKACVPLVLYIICLYLYLFEQTRHLHTYFGKSMLAPSMLRRADVSGKSSSGPEPNPVAAALPLAIVTLGVVEDDAETQLGDGCPSPFTEGGGGGGGKTLWD